MIELKDVCLLAVKYKRGHLYSDAKKKGVTGEQCEKASSGKCLFVLPTGRDWSVIKKKIAA